MNKNKLIKVVSLITGAITIVAIGYFVNEGSWNNVGFFSFLFLGYGFFQPF
mgnify:CR=1 FL=1